jgi:beta-1,4-N-acetylglucosaminyltransferase
MSKRLFVTVGSTTFSELIAAVLSTETLEVLKDLGFKEIILQYGAGERLYREGRSQRSTSISITGFDYSPSIQKEIEKADLVISHAGSGIKSLDLK